MNIKNLTIKNHVQKLGSRDIFFVMLPYLGILIEIALLPNLVILGKGLTFYIFVIFFIYSIIRVPKQLGLVLRSTMMITLILFFVSSYILESFHTNSYYREVSRTFYTLASVPLFAAWIKKNIHFMYYIVLSYIIFSLILSLNVIFSISLSSMLSSGDVESARGMVDENSYFFVNTNGLGWLAGTSTLLCIIIMRYYTLSIWYKRIFVMTAIILFYTLVICVARGAYLNFAFITIILLLKSKLKIKIQYYMWGLILSIFILSGVLAGVSNLIFSRFDQITLNKEEAADSRSLLYTKLLGYVDEVFLSGVGEGNYYGEWGQNTELKKERIDEDGFVTEVVPSTHNAFLQIIFYWGIIPLIIYLIFQIQVFSFVFKHHSGFYATVLLILVCSTASLLLFTGNFNAKDFSMIYGLLIGLKSYTNS